MDQIELCRVLFWDHFRLVVVMSNSGKFYTLILSLFIAIFYSTLFHSVLKDCLSRRKVTARGHSNLRYITPSAMETINIEEQQEPT